MVVLKSRFYDTIHQKQKPKNFKESHTMNTRNKSFYKSIVITLFVSLPALLAVLTFTLLIWNEYKHYQLTQNQTCQIVPTHNDKINLEVIHIYSRVGEITVNVNYPKKSINFTQTTHESLAKYLELSKNIKQFKKTGHYTLTNAIIYQCKVYKTTKYFLYKATVNDDFGNVIYPQIQFAWNNDDKKYTFKAFRNQSIWDILMSFIIIMSAIYAQNHLKNISWHK